METEHPFTLPRGYLDPSGKVHREGILRLATARDEIHVLADPRVRAHRAYSAVLLLSRVIVRLGDLEGEQVTPEVVESLFSADFAYLQGLYRRLNGDGSTDLATCPHCGATLRAE
ncbi:MAG: phage tail assembly protein [Planctomycetes bacterium]|nr:phage tail assembly protein [Planctomycetota bacterium]